METIKTLFSEEEAAAYLYVDQRTFFNWRKNGRGPIFSKLGQTIVYQKADLDAFVNSKRVTREPVATNA